MTREVTFKISGGYTRYFKAEDSRGVWWVSRYKSGWWSGSYESLGKTSSFQSALELMKSELDGAVVTTEIRDA